MTMPAKRGREKISDRVRLDWLLENAVIPDSHSSGDGAIDSWTTPTTEIIDAAIRAARKEK